MQSDLYYRIKDNGAVVFRIDTDNPQRRLDLKQIATVNTRNGDIKPQRGTDLSPGEKQQIESWLSKRQALQHDRAMDDVARLSDSLGQTAHWIQSRATDAEVDQAAEHLLMAMHDLRQAIVRRKSEKQE